VLPAQNASGNWVKVVQRVPVRLAVEVPPDAPPLRAGMSASVSIDTGRRRSLAELGETLRRWGGL
jgi:membrane fusion protein (multidrug efflux system)